LETAAVFFGLAGVSETAGSVEDFAEGIEVDYNIVSISFLLCYDPFLQSPPTFFSKSLISASVGF
jgi:hypothetical protein